MLISLTELLVVWAHFSDIGKVSVALFQDSVAGSEGREGLGWVFSRRGYVFR